MNKICTDIQQSQKLIELGVDINTADMFWDTLFAKNPEAQVNNHHLVDEYDDEHRVPAWSLTALLDILPTGKVLLHDKGNHGYKCICNNIDSYYFNNPVDACYDMILKLHEQKIL